MATLQYRVDPLRAAGLDAKWSKTKAGAPVIVVRRPTGHPLVAPQWYYCDESMFKDMQLDGILEAFDSHTILGDIFSI